MREFKIVYMDGYDEVREVVTQEVLFSTKIDEDIAKWVGRTTMSDKVIEDVVTIWNKTGKAELNLWSGGAVDNYLLEGRECTQDEREVIVESLAEYAMRVDSECTQDERIVYPEATGKKNIHPEAAQKIYDVLTRNQYTNLEAIVEGDWVLFPKTKDDRDNPLEVGLVESVSKFELILDLNGIMIPIPKSYCKKVNVHV